MTDFDPFDIQTAQARENDRRHTAAMERRAEAEDWSWLLASKRGRRIVRELLDVAGVARSSFTGSSETFYREGQRAIGLHILRQAWTHAREEVPNLLRADDE
jgi:hypothetical protein